MRVILGKASFWLVNEATRASFSFWVAARDLPTKARYCSMVSFGGVETGKS